jgi:hypothetical protein
MEIKHETNHEQELTISEADKFRRKLQGACELRVEAVSKYCNHVLLLGTDPFLSERHRLYKK